MAAPHIPGSEQSPASPGTSNPSPSEAPSNNTNNDLASNTGSFGTSSASNSGFSGMIGDLTSGFSTSAFGNVAIAGGDLRAKIADNTSPRPTDRAFFNYNYFNRPLTAADGLKKDLNRFQFGMERTFLDEEASLEFRIPFESGLAATQFFGGPTPDSRDVGVTFGNVSLTPKFVLYDCCDLLISTGLEIQLPTAANSVTRNTVGLPLLTLENQSVNLEPFVGALWTPSPQFFSIAYLQFDFDAGRIHAIDNVGGGTFDIQQQTLMYFDINFGYWFYEDPCADCVRGIAAVLELHNTTAISKADQPVGSPFAGGGSIPNNILDLTAGLDFKIGTNSILTVAGGVPLGNANNRTFNSEFILQLNYLR